MLWGAVFATETAAEPARNIAKASPFANKWITHCIGLKRCCEPLFLMICPRLRLHVQSEFELYAVLLAILLFCDFFTDGRARYLAQGKARVKHCPSFGVFPCKVTCLELSHC